MIFRVLIGRMYPGRFPLSLTWIKEPFPEYIRLKDHAMDVVTLLEQSEFFRAVSASSRRAVASICIPKVLHRREVLFVEGEKGHAMFLVAQGTIQLFKSSEKGREVIIKLVKPGELFGEVVLYEEDRFPVSASALTPAHVFLLPRKQFDCLLEEEGFRRDFIAMLLSKQRYLTEQIFRLSALDVEERFFHFLRDHYG